MEGTEGTEGTEGFLSEAAYGSDLGGGDLDGGDLGDILISLLSLL